MVLQELERARVGKVIGSSLEACVNISATGEDFQLLKRYRDDLRYIFIVSQVNVLEGADPKVEVEVTNERASGETCERCWTYSTRVGESMRYPTACERCTIALAEIEEEGAGA